MIAILTFPTTTDIFLVKVFFKTKKSFVLIFFINFLKNKHIDHANFISNGQEVPSIGPVCITLEEPGKYETKALIRLKEVKNEAFNGF